MVGGERPVFSREANDFYTVGKWSRTRNAIQLKKWGEAKRAKKRGEGTPRLKIRQDNRRV